MSALRLIGAFHSHSGYSKLSRAALRTAIVAGYDVQAIESDMMERVIGLTNGRRLRESVLPTPKTDLPEEQQRELTAALDRRVPDGSPTLLIQLPNNLAAWPQYADGPMIGWTMSESDNLCHSWQHGCRNVDLILAPSSYCLDTFARVVPKVASDLLPLPVDDRLWTPDEYAGEIPRRPAFLFLSVFKPSERKNWRMLVQAFAEEFRTESQEVGLFIKSTGGTDVEGLCAACRDMGAWVYNDAAKCTDWVLASLYRACDVYLQPSCEGFGLCPVEAALCGKPSVALSLGGAADVVNEDNGYLVPSTMAPLIGHNPHIYPRSHRFATCDIDDLRDTLRRAYVEEKSGAKKGLAARQTALDRFTPEAVAPALRKAIDLGICIRSDGIIRAHRAVKPELATAAGNWGDVFCCVGNIKRKMAEHNLSKIGVIFYGSDSRIADWLKLQPWCREVMPLIEKDRAEMTRVFGRMCQCRPIHGEPILRDLLRESVCPQLAKSEIAFTHLCLSEPRQPNYWDGAVLPNEAREWAEERAEQIGEPFLLLNPLSLASNPMANHWPYWSEAIDWLTRDANCPVVLIGEQPIEWPDAPRLFNLSGRTPSMMHVLALAELSAGVISTANNLGIYAPIAHIPTVIAITRTCGPETFYHRWMETDDVTLVEFGDAFCDFKEAVRDRFGDLVPAAVEEEPDEKKETVNA
jgi:glycosyltransferase involved in cell wall biosynthesis